MNPPGKDGAARVGPIYSQKQEKGDRDLCLRRPERSPPDISTQPGTRTGTRPSAAPGTQGHEATRPAKSKEKPRHVPIPDRHVFAIEKSRYGVVLLRDPEAPELLFSSQAPVSLLPTTQYSLNLLRTPYRRLSSSSCPGSRPRLRWGSPSRPCLAAVMAPPGRLCPESRVSSRDLETASWKLRRRKARALSLVSFGFPCASHPFHVGFIVCVPAKPVNTASLPAYVSRTASRPMCSRPNVGRAVGTMCRSCYSPSRILSDSSGSKAKTADDITTPARARKPSSPSVPKAGEAG